MQIAELAVVERGKIFAAISGVTPAGVAVNGIAHVFEQHIAKLSPTIGAARLEQERANATQPRIAVNVSMHCCIRQSLRLIIGRVNATKIQVSTNDDVIVGHKNDLDAVFKSNIDTVWN